LLPSRSQGKIAFASVHDSYWTHACDVDEMSVILREAFIELHSQDILGRLRQEVRFLLCPPCFSHNSRFHAP
jgi:DNA-directed RNA polymerase